MSLPTHDHLRALLAPTTPPCVSLYMPAHRRHPEWRQDPVRFRGLLREARQRLAERLPAREVESLLEPLEALSRRSFWEHQKEGLAVLRSRDLFQFHLFPAPVPELLVVDDTFHVKPLIRHLQRDDRFFVLALGAHGAELHAGTREGLVPVEVPGLPGPLAEVRPPEERTRSLSSHATATGGSAAMFHGQGGGGEQRKDDLVPYFRRVDEAVAEALPGERAPLLIAAVGYYHPLYREVSRLPNLVSERIEGSPDTLAPEALHARAWEAVAARLQAAERELVAAYGDRAAAGRAADEVAGVAAAAVQGRVERLFVARGRSLAGVLDRASGAVRLEGGDGGADVLDDLAEVVLLRGGDVRVVEPEQMPTGSPVAALFRY